MHSFHWEHPKPEKQFNDPISVTIHHNGDYSGQAKVEVHFCPNDEVCVNFASLSPENNCYGLEVPAKALVAFAGDAVRSEIVSAIEDIDLQWGVVNRIAD